jgi:hypothetical protein
MIPKDEHFYLPFPSRTAMSAISSILYSPNDRLWEKIWKNSSNTVGTGADGVHGANHNRWAQRWFDLAGIAEEVIDGK